MFQCLGRMRKIFIPGNFSWSVAAEAWDASSFKKGLLEKQQSVLSTCPILSLKKMFYQNLTDAFLKYIPLKYIKLVIPKILFVLVLCSFNVYFKIAWKQNYHPSPNNKLKFLIAPPPPPANGFLKFLTPLSGCMLWNLTQWN